MNAAQHAEASSVRIAVAVRGDTVQLVVEDDGVGFAPAARGVDGRQAGLVLSREKVQLSGGLLFVDSTVGSGTTVTVRVPLGAA